MKKSLPAHQNIAISHESSFYVEIDLPEESSVRSVQISKTAIFFMCYTQLLVYSSASIKISQY